MYVCGMCNVGGVCGVGGVWHGTRRSGYGMGDKGAKLLASGTASLPSIKFMSLRGNRLSHVGTCAVLSVLRPFGLMTLDLSHNNIGMESCKLLAKLVMVRAAPVVRWWCAGGALWCWCCTGGALWCAAGALVLRCVVWQWCCTDVALLLRCGATLWCASVTLWCAGVTLVVRCGALLVLPHRTTA